MNKWSIIEYLWLVVIALCPDGYIYIEGDIIGATIQGAIKTTLDNCAKLCTDKPQCNSFEHASNHCNLNKESNPNGPKYNDFIFCTKIGNLLI